MKKSIVTLAIAVLLLFSAAGSVLAAPTDSASENAGTGMRLTLISTVTPTLSVSGTTATYGLAVQCASSVIRINATLQLQTKNSSGTWGNYGSSWTAASTTSSLITSGTKTVTSGAAYRLAVTITVSDGTTTATQTAYSA